MMEIAGWPKLVINYEADPAHIAALLPPGIEPGAEPLVQIGVYCVPVQGEPEYGISTKVAADYQGTAGWFSLGIGIDQESAIFISQERNGQPKFPCSVRYFRRSEHVEASATHQGRTFMEFAASVASEGDVDAEPEENNEWWIKQSRAIGGGEGEWDFPPHVVRVRMVSRKIWSAQLDGELRFHESPWDPYTELLPIKQQLNAELVLNEHHARDITNVGPLDPVAFWPYADTISGSRWPGNNGGPRR